MYNSTTFYYYILLLQFNFYHSRDMESFPVFPRSLAKCEMFGVSVVTCGKSIAGTRLRKLCSVHILAYHTHLPLARPPPRYHTVHGDLVKSHTSISLSQLSLLLRAPPGWPCCTLAYSISRQVQDDFTCLSFQKAAAAQKDGKFKEESFRSAWRSSRCWRRVFRKSSWWPKDIYTLLSTYPLALKTSTITIRIFALYKRNHQGNYCPEKLAPHADEKDLREKQETVHEDLSYAMPWDWPTTNQSIMAYCLEKSSDWFPADWPITDIVKRYLRGQRKIRSRRNKEAAEAGNDNNSSESEGEGEAEGESEGEGEGEGEGSDSGGGEGSLSKAGEGRDEEEEEEDEEEAARPLKRARRN
ncbi:hypothetical protein BDZ97DRAFT_2045789 [Flammula alnicola]|nr:hypothetical protein BDZ97DRAFT_2045789 [Flammula alnicola]